ncbi:non-hydrolyzing UDP-N-acetylglucosamine 2-epimerase, partial [Thermodesulfobacteriota bacterium]
MKIVTIIGARPQFVKAASVSRAIYEYNTQNKGQAKPIEEVIIHTGQHFDTNMSDIFFEEMNIPKPDYNLGINSASHGAMTGRMLIRIEEILIREKPDWVNVYGDTNSTLAGALASAKLNISVAHVESGLRSFNRRMPEEHNRVLTDHCSDILFCPTDTAVKNLENEGITKGVYKVGDVMFDSVLYNIKLTVKHSKIIESLKLKPKAYALATIHRAENTDNIDRLNSIFSALEQIASNGLPVVVPLHPRTRKILNHSDITLKYITIIEPISYIDMLMLEKEASLIFTDSGGVQKEAYWMKVPCITLRDETEWVETIEEGWNIIAGADTEMISKRAFYNTWPSAQKQIFGDG